VACSRCSTPSSSYLPSPLDVPAMQGHAPGNEEEKVTRQPSKDEPFSALAFKVASHPFFGTLTFIRVYSGRISAGTQVLNSTKVKKERIGKLFQMHANKENPVDEALWPATSTPPSASRTRPPVTPCATSTSRSSSSR
jgi:translation elongation factor EF-G